MIPSTNEELNVGADPNKICVPSWTVSVTMQVQAAGAPVNKYGYDPEDESVKSTGKKKKKWAKKVAVRLGDVLGGLLNSPMFGN